MNKNMKTARIAGWFYLVYIASTILVSLLRSNLSNAESAAEAARLIAASDWPLRLSIVLEALSGLLFLLTAWALYVLLNPVNHPAAVLFLTLNAAGAAVQVLNNTNLLAVLLISKTPGLFSSFQPAQLQDLTFLFFHLHTAGFWILQIFFGAWLLPLGYLVYKSGILPRALGVVLMVHCVFWLLTFFQYFLFPELAQITYISYPLGIAAEFGLSLWLIIFGAKAGPPAPHLAVRLP